VKRLPHDFDPDEIRLIEELGPHGFESRCSGHCPRPEMIQALVAGALPAGETKTVQLHIESCPSCRMVHRAIADCDLPAPGVGDVDLLWTRVSEGIPAKRRFVWHWGWAVAAAASVVAAIAMSQALLTPKPATMAFAPQIPASPALPAWDLSGYDRPPVRLPVEGLLVWRGAGETRIPDHTRDVAKALEPYRGGDLREAERRLAALEARYPRSFEVAFYRGVCLLYLDRPAAASHLSRARELANPSQSADAAWYLSLAYLRRGSIRDAHPLLAGLCAGAAAHSQSACQALNQLARIGPPESGE
jgi:hypothetical protein